MGVGCDWKFFRFFLYFFLGVTEWYPDDDLLGLKHVATIKRTRVSFVNSFYLLTDLTRTQRGVLTLNSKFLINKPTVFLIYTELRVLTNLRQRWN
jgi:hypothetical protein